MVQLANSVWRNFVTDGVPASGNWAPQKKDVRQWGAYLEGFITAFTSNGGLIYISLAAMNADLLHGAASSAWVVGDATVANNGIYRKIGASGAGSWSRVADLPYSFIRATDAGAGTTNAIIATTTIPLPANDGATLIALNIFVNNTGAATVAFNGGSPLTIKTNNGNDVAASYLVAGAIVAGYVSGSTFRLISDVSTAADRAAAEAAASASSASAAAAAASASSINLPSPAANTMLVRNSANTAYVASPFADIRDGLDVPLYVADRTALKAVDTTKDKVAFLQEAGRQGIFVWTAGNFSTQITADTLEGVYVKATAIASSSGAWVRAYTGALNVSWFGAVGGGTANDTSAIQAAVNLVGFLGGGIAYIPVGSFKTTAAVNVLSNNVRIMGAGTATKVKPATAGQDVFVFGDGTNQIQHAGIHNLMIEPTALIECGVRAKDYFWFECRGVKVAGSHNVGIELERGVHGSYLAFLERCFTDQSTLYGAAVGRLGSGSILGVYLNNVHLDGASVAGLNVESVSGLIWSGGEALGGSRALRLSPAAGQQVRACTFNNLALDTTTNEIVRLEMISSGRRISTIKFDSVSFNASLTSAGMIIAGLPADATLIDQVQINNCEFTINCSHGLYTTYCTDIDITGTQFTSNGQPGVGDGVYLDTGTSNVRMTGGSSNGGSGFASTQLFGVLIAPGVTGVVLDGINLAGNVTGAISDGGTGTIISNCTGAKTFNRGQAQLLIGTTSVAVTHGLAFTPAVSDITLTNLVDPGVSGVTRLWVSATSATTFTVSTNVAAPSGHFFGWSVGVKGS